ncbi:MAG TPA: type I-E CRISPR-associated protein Cse1/CasA [Verrucomicrobiae bacterium]|nr:type I-E CRISPR-associated protein Cse1/CasA [Verrucomicrobiae bacterium]
MNLTTDPWIPALCADGHRELFSLQALFAQAHKLRDLAAKPHERVALMRLLLCITQAALDGPADEAEWETCEPLIQTRVRDYLAKYKPAFELFGESSRFLQLNQLSPIEESDDGNASTKLDLSLATGNNSTVFDNSAGEERSLQPSRLAVSLVTFQCFSPGGRIGVAKWSGKETPGKGSSNHGPCTPSSMLHTFMLGDNLRSSIHRNLLTKESVMGVSGPDRWGKPVWEFPVQDSGNRTAVENATLTYLGRLAPLCRAIHLHTGGRSLILANGLDYPVFPIFREATATIIKRKDQLALLPASTARSVWRQLAAISIKRRIGADQTCGPLALSHVSDPAETRLWIGALITDKAKIEDVVESTYWIPAAMLTELGHAAYEHGVAYADEWEGALIQAVKAYAVALKIGTPPYDRARQRFWTHVEQNLTALFAIAANHDLIARLPKTDWGQAVADSASDAYQSCCPRQSPRQIHAYVLGLRKLIYRPKTNADAETVSKAHE